MVGHTPGPWEVAIILDARRQIPEGAAIAVGAPNGTTKTPGHRSVVALCGHPGDDFHADASFADAHLIAAAPALLEACRVALRLSSWAVLSEVTSSAHSHSERRADEYDAKVRAAEDQIRAAIAKAEGAALSAARPAPTEGDS